MPYPSCFQDGLLWGHPVVGVVLVVQCGLVRMELLVCLLTCASLLMFICFVYCYRVMKTDRFIARLFDIYQESCKQGNVQVRCRVVCVSVYVGEVLSCLKYMECVSTVSLGL